MYGDSSNDNNAHYATPKRRNDKNIPLPKLPPLRTRASNDSHFDYEHEERPKLSTPSRFTSNSSEVEREYAASRSTPISAQSSTSRRIVQGKTPTIRRRPPPPPPPPRSSSIYHNNSSTPNPSYRSFSPVTPEQNFHNNMSLYDSPFVGKPSSTNYLYDQNKNQLKSLKTVAYPSPFVGDLHQDPELSSSISNTEQHIFSSTNEESDQLNDSIKVGMTIDTDIEFYSRPPRPIPNSRVVSEVSRQLDGIDSYYSDSNYTFNNSSARHSSYNSFSGGKPLEMIPSITTPTQPFHIDFLDENKLYQCYCVYRLSDIYEWILKIYFEWFNEYVFGKLEFYQVVQRLLEFQVPNSCDQDTIDSNVDKIIESLVIQDAVRFEKRSQPQPQQAFDKTVDTIDGEFTVITGGLDVQGIFTELLPCYSFADTTFEQVCSSSCYSFICMNSHSHGKRKEVKLADIIKKPLGLWTDYWHISSEELSQINPHEIQRQSYIFDLIILEERSLNMANAAVEIYGKRFDPKLLPDQQDFSDLAFDVFRPLIDIHKTYILEPIFRKIEIKGKFIDGIGTIYLKWCNEARESYLRYAKAMATVHEIIKWEKQHGTRFSRWLDEVDHSPEITRSKMYYDVIFFGGYFKSLQNMTVTLSSILKVTDPSMEDYDYLTMVIKDIEKLSSEVDKVHGNAIDRRKLLRFSSQLLRDVPSKGSLHGYSNVLNSSNNDVNYGEQTNDSLDIGINNPERMLLLSGKVLKKRELWLDPTPVFLVLLDNYLLVTETIVKNDNKKYKLVERPIPIDYLNLEKKVKYDDSQSVLSSNKRDSKVYSTITPSTPLTGSRPNLYSASNASRTIVSAKQRETRTGISNVQPSESELSFKIRNTATNESITFITSNLNEKELWIKNILGALQNNEKNDNSNVLDFFVVSTQFSYSDKDAPVNLPVAPEGSEIDYALKSYEVNNRNNDNLRNFPMVTNILCTEEFEFEDEKFLLVATSNGILVRLDNGVDTPFVKVIQCGFVSKMEVNKKLGLLFILDDRNLCYFNIPSIFGAYYDRKKYLSSNLIIGVVLRDKVGYFKFASDFGHSRHLLYERKGKIMILTPEFDNVSKVFKYFKEYKEYKLPSNGLTRLDVYDIVVLKKCFIVCTTKGALLYRDVFGEECIILPTFYNDSTMKSDTNSGLFNSSLFKSGSDMSSHSDIATHKMAGFVKRDIATNKTKPLTCFELNDGTGNFLIVYDEAVVKVNKHGEIPDWTEDILILDFYCTGTCYYKDHLILVGDSLIQIYSLKNSTVSLSRMIPNQIIKGKKVLLVSSSGNDEFKVVLSHPDIPSRQLLMTCELVGI
ncbi:similar to Saccharomyces cerevisiae YLR425W TUS1 Guanine nucleotide exchange factor (GEF) that functions to modulate Rho1p activity as part of the cell integrity signaling pathway [Maudiozyma barnettii]|uniref:Similar to Saccharomyces cerevisiae YLR425W TUS1 Guanine nucleotide exchange factor (GEF) that functions to modulate Rho1p activity as part of the cell integrity signaling pathway n=1 Tax=Maudiozyma barnettii TaxID=61262 RepID=A0A8H2VJH8_9SACH|nr:Rho family guanine nucleotide exchange factor TUS1 [Kazachstania barnettii]CAB4256531.1 similar to Saccharomyces cerevisiae YLR425W TUS1 Guanine nucleotide exchange factor (GEF) that functions to modulate Rho1p activity as part of the cell integrity signaling pathway [Kazachstania barnettii]CAD1785134.1 similar to Saccharomyces cerevisiae YLR425W TUS1 Guanine nucleotide exchange factor (GEF) that functions to modulate Rho1p activity as part of the cell integrity signaling pathway [Kazachstania